MVALLPLTVVDQPVMVPPSPAKMNCAGAEPVAVVITKSVVPL